MESLSVARLIMTVGVGRALCGQTSPPRIPCAEAPLVLLSHKAALMAQCMVQFRSVAGLERIMTAESEDRFAAYVEALSAGFRHAGRRGPFRDYGLGLLMPVERKSVEPLTAVTVPGRTAAQHQSLLHFMGRGSWSDKRVLNKV